MRGRADYLRNGALLILIGMSIALSVGFERDSHGQVPSGLMAGYAFDEGSGSSAADSSGRGNTGSLVGPDWITTGHPGNALLFNGSGDRVNVNDDNDLDLTTGMTLEAWVFPTSSSGTFRAVVIKQRTTGPTSPAQLSYALYSQTSTSLRPGAYVAVGTSNFSAIPSTGGALPLNTWTHLAATYVSGSPSVLRLYVNGALAATTTVSPGAASILTSGSALQIGGITNQFFQGRIDEVRVYNRALSQAEIQADSTAPVDTTPPTITSRNPGSGATNVSVTANITATFSDAMDATTITTDTVELLDPASNRVPATVSYNASTRVATLDPVASLAGSTTYTARVRGGATDPRVKDVAGNAMASTSTWSFTTIDTTPPTIISRAPESGTTGVGVGASVSVTFSEPMTSSTISTSTVQLRNHLNQLVSATVGYNSSTRTATLTPNAALGFTTTYTATVRGGSTGVKDAVGNALVADQTWSFVTGGAPTGMVAAYALNEGSGSLAFDSSGNGLTGEISGATWTSSGRFSNALSFDGIADVIQVAHGAPLGLTTGMTLEAWVFPTDLSGWRAVILKAAGGGLSYGLYASDGAGPVAFINTGSNDVSTPSGAPLNLNAWSHLAATYDGTTLRLYVNGALAGSQPHAGGLLSSSDPLGIGGNPVLSEPFEGRIDEVRIYNRALSSSEIQGDMGTALGAPPPDTTPPTVVAVAPAQSATGVSTATPVTATFSEPMDPATISGSTVELRNALNTVVSGTVSYDAQTRQATFTPAATLASTATYTATVRGGAADPRVKDTSGNALAANFTWSFTTGNCAAPPNPIAAENCLPGNPPSEWDVAGIGDASIQGFATDISVNRGQTVRFKIDTTASAYRIDIYRLGYYSGLGARRVATISSSATIAQNQPDCLTDDATGLIDCGNWAQSASWLVPANAVSGVYIARPRRNDNGGASHIVFIVRQDGATSDLLFQTSDTTWQAYNDFGGNSLYVGGPGTNPGRAYKVSYNRPFNTRIVDNGQDWLFNSEYPTIRWLEANGYNVTYMAGVDTDRRGGELLTRRAFLSVGHDEYWSATQRANVEAARNAGKHLSFFSGNEIFWKVRWEPSIDGTGTQHRTLVSYKETHANAKIDPQPNVWTGSWRDPRFSPPADGGRPENALSGTIFMVNSGTTAIQVPEADGKMRFWRNTSVATLPAETTATLGPSTLGYEWDADRDNGARPPGLVRLSTTTASGVSILQDQGSTYANGTATHNMTFYKHSSGARVFSAGTIQWAWGLDSHHDRGNAPADVRMQQATVNLFADMSVQPTTLQVGLVAAAASTDTAAPTSTITSPAAGGSVPRGGVVTIQGTAADTGGGVVGGVEISVDGGATWHPVNGRGSWSYVWSPVNTGATTIRTRAVDDSGNLETPGAGITVNVTGSSTCPCVAWDTSVVPTVPAEPGDAQPVEVGVKFRVDVNGWVTAIRFYKGEANTGPQVVNLWSASGALLASNPLIGGTAVGWQSVPLGVPVAVVANTTYVASYHTASGHYAVDENYFATARYLPPIRLLADGEDGPNGVFRYGASGFPTDTFSKSNYWVDIVFSTTQPVDTTPPVVTEVTPAGGSTGVSTETAVTARFSEPINPATVTASTFQLRTANNVQVSATLSYDPQTRRATLVPNVPLALLTSYTATLKGGGTDPRIKDANGNALAADVTWSFNTVGLPPGQGPGGPVLIISNTSNPFTRYYAEILRAEGLNLFAVQDMNPALTLAGFDVVILGEMTLTPAQVGMLTAWVNGGGRLIAMRPDKQLAGLLGLTDTATTLSNAYLLMDTSQAPGSGLVGQTIQFHGTADRYTLNGATAVATLYQDASTPSNPASPAVTVRAVGSSGGQAAAFTYDLARSVVYTRQGNPAWAGQERDGTPPIRPDDLFFGAAAGDTAPDWINLSKVAIPQADEQQRLLANLILHLNRDRKPLPRFWYFPGGVEAVVVMTGDDHAIGGTAGRFEAQKAASAPGCSVDSWECVRSTSYIYPGTPLSSAQVTSYTAEGFEIALHVNTGCADWTPGSLEGFYADQLSLFASGYPGAPPPATNRTHCIVWSDWSTQPEVQLAHGIRLDTSYYYWPDSWIQNRPGMFTGSGMPMRFAKEDGTLIDVYQATTQMTDESGQTFPFTINTLLDRAVGAEGYYGAFVANMHTDNAGSSGADAIIASALAHQIPVVSARQLLTWLDGRNGSSFGSLSMSGGTLSFTVFVGAGATNLGAMLPRIAPSGVLTSLSRDGTPISFDVTTIKGVDYAYFPAVAGTYQAIYATDTVAPTVTAATPSDGATGVVLGTNAQAVFSEAMDPATINDTTFELLDGSNVVVPAAVTYDGASRTATLDPTGSLADGTTYTAVLKGGSSGVKDLVGNPLTQDVEWSFTTAPCPCSIWTPSTVPTNVDSNDNNAQEVGLKFRTTSAGFITAIRFYKSPANTGPHVGNLWTTGGTLLGSVTFTSETASGWQQAQLPSAVAVAANTTYIVSYYTPVGRYSFDHHAFATAGVDSGPLHALSNGEGGGNGVFKLGTSGFPTQSFNETNYWVDVVFSRTASPSNCPCSFWDDTTVPANVDSGEAVGIELGLKFQVSVGGTVTGVRFYKSAANIGPHIGNLWAGDGSLLATVNIPDTGTTGWQEALFPAPVPVSPGSTYVISYYAPVGHFSFDPAYFTVGQIEGPLHAPANSEVGGNGVFRQGPSGFPTDTFNANNYWVDVIFQ